MKILRTFFLFFFLCILSGHQFVALAGEFVESNYSYRRYTIHDGLPNLLLETLFQDNKGFIWIATYRGFVRFDGISFTPFRAESTINILHLENGEDGSVRAYTYHDMFVADINDSIRAVDIAPEDLYINSYNSRDLPEGYSILENENATEKYLVFFQNDTITEILRCPELNQIADTKPFLDLSNNIFYLPSRTGLNIYDMTSKKTMTINGLVVENFLRHHILGLLAFGIDGVYKIEGDKYEKLADARFELDKRAVEMADGSIIIKDRKSVYRYRDGLMELLAEFNASVVDVLCDAENNLWLATHDGLYNFFHLDFKNYNLKKDVIKTVLEDKSGNIWMGTLHGDLLCMSGGVARKINYSESTEYSFLHGSVMVDNRLFFPRDNDVLIYDNGAFSWAGLPYRLEDYDGYTKVVPYKDGNVLILRGIGVYLCNRYGKIIRFFSQEDLKQPDLYDIVVDQQGRWLIAGHLGISIVEGDSVRLFNNNRSDASPTLCADDSGQIWLGSANCINLLRNDSIVTVHSFSNDIVQGIFTVDKDYLLITTMRGIHFFDMSEYLRSGKLQFLHYNQNNGFTGLNPQVSNIFKDSNGMFWLSCNDCLVTFYPKELIRKTQSPKLHILKSDVSVDNVRWTSVTDFDKSFLYKNRNFRFSFIGINYSAVENVRYSYRLKGFQDEWNEPVKLREVTFNNLLPGNYVFEIYADAGTYDSRSEISQLSFSISPAFWQTWWFLTLAILSLVVAGAAIVLNIQHRKNNRLIERLETEKQLNELRLKSIRLRSIPHFNANVLAAVEYYIMNRSKDEANRLLNIYSEFTSRTLREVDKPSRSLHDELEYVQLYLKLEKLRFLEKFNYEVDIDSEIEQDVQLPNMILHTYCENAIKHGFVGRSSGCLLKISARHKNDAVEVKVEDNGVGRAYAAQNKNVRSTKQGLNILEQQIAIYNTFNENKIEQHVADIHDGNIPSGTCFMITVPYKFVYNN